MLNVTLAVTGADVAVVGVPGAAERGGHVVTALPLAICDVDGAPLPAIAGLDATLRAAGTRDARVIRAEADAEAARIYAESFGQDGEFYDFYRAMQSYEATFARGEGRGESSIIMSQDNEFLRQFRGRR